MKRKINWKINQNFKKINISIMGNGFVNGKETRGKQISD